jgi:tRNA-dihydrouridine synthase A
MMDWTDRHDRYFLRLISKHTVLYTEMITTGALLYGDAERHLRFNSQEHPVAVQLGGSNPKHLAESAKLCEDYGYDEINLNVGCPSDRVQSGKIGACLMAEPELVADCVAAMVNAVNVPVTVKHRIGIDDNDSYESLNNFVGIVADSGCKTFIVHARKAILDGLSPKENRQIPPLQYQKVYQLKQDFPELEIIINGGIKTLSDSQQHLDQVDGVMIGREAYQNPYILAQVDPLFYSDGEAVTSRHDIVKAFMEYIELELAKGTRLQAMVRHILGLFHAQPRGKLWRRHLSENAYKPGAGIDIVEKALELVAKEV